MKYEKERTEAKRILTPSEFHAWDELMLLDDDESRLRVIQQFCRYCGTSTIDSVCYCWNDE